MNNKYKTKTTKMNRIIRQIDTNIENKFISQIKLESNIVLGYITIDKINLNYPIIKYKNDSSLNIAITHYYGPELNNIGNVVLAGHRTNNGLLFGKNHKLKKGDIIKITRIDGNVTNYVITKTLTVSNDDKNILTNSKDKELTLITCTIGNQDRLIIKAKEQK